MENAKLITLDEKDNGQKFMLVLPQATLEEIVLHPDCPQLLKNSVEVSASWHLRVETTLEKAVLSPALVPQWAAALLAIGTGVISDNGDSMALNTFMQNRGPRKIAKVIIPMDHAARQDAEARIGITPSDTAIIYAAGSLTIENDTVKEAVIALTGAWKQTVNIVSAADLLKGKKADAALLQEVVSAAFSEFEPRGDYRGSETYRKEMGKVAVRRVLETCLEGAQS